MKLPPDARFPTICIHAGQTPDPGTGAIITPIFQTSTYVQEALGQHKGYEYARTQNPTRSALEHNIAAIEGGAAAFAFASGMAAIDAVTTLLEAGDHVVVTDNTYGGTFRLFDRVLRKYRLEFSYVDTSQPALVERAMQPNTKMLFVETPTNPVMRLTDLEEAASIALGADLVVHSTTKYLNGHSDSVGGVVVAARDEDAAWLAFVQNAAGAILSPFDSWLVLRGTKTLTVRMAQHNVNGMALAEYLSGHAKVARVYYPGLPDHPQHALAKRQMRGFGGMLSFDVGTFEAARAVCNGVRLMALAESLGGVETLISHPASMTHASVPPERRRQIGLTDSMVRISAGIEDPQDLIADLAQALA
jgi:cystathionine beta-lyase/cystathionine gamma-synthase